MRTPTPQIAARWPRLRPRPLLLVAVSLSFLAVIVSFGLLCTAVSRAPVESDLGPDMGGLDYVEVRVEIRDSGSGLAVMGAEVYVTPWQGTLEDESSLSLLKDRFVRGMRSGVLGSYGVTDEKGRVALFSDVFVPAASARSGGSQRPGVLIVLPGGHRERLDPARGTWSPVRVGSHYSVLDLGTMRLP